MGFFLATQCVHFCNVKAVRKRQNCQFIQRRNSPNTVEVSNASKILFSTSFVKFREIFTHLLRRYDPLFSSSRRTASSGNKSVLENDGLVKDGTKCGSNKVILGEFFVLNIFESMNFITSDLCRWSLRSFNDVDGRSQLSFESRRIALFWTRGRKKFFTDWELLVKKSSFYFFYQVCTNLNSCYCNEGWDGNDCSVKLEKQRPVLMSTFFPETSSRSSENFLTKNFNFHSMNSSSLSTTTIAMDDILFGSPICKFFYRIVRFRVDFTR